MGASRARPGGTAHDDQTHPGIRDQLPGERPIRWRIASELGRLSNFGQIKVVDAVSVTREGDDVATFSVSVLDADQRAEFRTAVGALVGFGSAGDEGAVRGAELGASIDLDGATAAHVVAASLIAELPDGSSAWVLTIEHMWAVPLRSAVRDAGGVVVAHRWLAPEELVFFGTEGGGELAEADRRAG